MQSSTSEGYVIVEILESRFVVPVFCPSIEALSGRVLAPSILFKRYASIGLTPFVEC